jgi:hypothetical protein
MTKIALERTNGPDKAAFREAGEKVVGDLVALLRKDGLPQYRIDEALSWLSREVDRANKTDYEQILGKLGQLILGIQEPPSAGYVLDIHTGKWKPDLEIPRPFQR